MTERKLKQKKRQKKSPLDKTIDKIEKNYQPVKELKPQDKGKKTIVIIAENCGDRTHIVYNYTSDIAIASEVNQTISRLVSKGYRGIRVIKGEELEYPFKVA